MMTAKEIMNRAAEKGQDAVISYGHNMIVVSQKTIANMEENAQRMSEAILQLGTMIGTMQRRMEEMEARQAAVTISHADVKRIQARIRSRADETCRKYSLADTQSQKIFRAAIKKDVLRRWQVKDLHDLPVSAQAAAENLIDGWTNIRLVMERRGSA